MRKFYKAAAVAAILGTIGFAGAGTAFAGGEGNSFKVEQSAKCVSHDLTLDVLGEVGLLNGVLGNAANGEDNPGAQATDLSSKQGCNNYAF